MKTVVKDVLMVSLPGRRRLWNRQRKDLEEALKLQKALLKEYRSLAEVEQKKCASENLRRWDVDAFTKFLSAPESTKGWDDAKKLRSQIDIPEMTGGVNPGDQRLIFSLIKYLQPKNVLEIGTHIGASTVHIATALKLNKLTEKTHLTSVDIKDVNNEDLQPWKEFGSKYSPKQMLARLGVQDLVTFITADSVDFLENTTQHYDFIFLDGNHSSVSVYSEIPLALRRLCRDGVVLLHDFFPDLDPLWPEERVTPSVIHKSVIAGPFLAVQRLEREGCGCIAIPFGKLPWPTKLGTNITSLALLTKTPEKL